MSTLTPAVLALLLDTSYLRAVGARHPDFRKLLELAKRNDVKIFVPHIAWEEWRTQLLDDALQDVQRLRDAAEKLRRPWLGGIAVDGLLPAGIVLPSDGEIGRRSVDAMERFATENGITVVPLGLDHAERAWGRYFRAEPPFNRAQKRENRRKDIPDSWICEAAVDLGKDHAGLIALSGDDNLCAALVAQGMKVLRTTQQALDAIVAGGLPAAVTAEESTADSAEPVPDGDGLGKTIAQAEAALQDLQRKVLGYVGYLGNLSKSQLFEMMAAKGYPADAVRNVAERLALSGLLEDTGNHYIPRDKEACALAAPLVEAEIIEWLSKSDG